MGLVCNQIDFGLVLVFIVWFALIPCLGFINR